MLRVYRYRLYPTRAQDVTLRETLSRQRELYNAALQERRDAYRNHGLSISKGMQERQLKDVRVVRPEYKSIHTHLLQDTLHRLDKAFKAFFRRVKAGEEKPGYPRYKGRGRYRTFTFKDVANRNGVRIVAGGQRVELTGIGRVKVKLHRPIAGTVKQVSVTLNGDGHWYVAFACVDVPADPLPVTGASVGVDVGLKTFATLSTGEEIANPRPFVRAQKRLADAHRRVARRKKGSARRRKAVELLGRQSDRVARARRDFHHKEALKLVRRFDTIKVEDLNILGLAAGMLAKHVLDAAWGLFFTILASKAESAGRELHRVDPRGTSQECSRCGATARKALVVRIHICPECGLVLGRDHNAAINVEKRPGHGRRRRGEQWHVPLIPRSPSLTPSSA